MTTPTTSSLSLSDFPEELLDRILALSLSPSPVPPSPRPAWHPPSSSRPRTRIAPLLICRRLARIGTPHLYHAIHLAAPTTTRLLLKSLHSKPALAEHVRVLSLASVTCDAGAVMSLCRGVTSLEIMLDGMHGDGDDVAFVRGLRQMKEVRHLTLRKPGTVYLSLPRARFVITGLAAAIDEWPDLETANIAFKLSDDTPTSPVAGSTPVFSSFIPAPQRSQTLPLSFTPTPPTDSPPSSPLPLPHGPITALTTALARAPNLHTFTTHLPSVWNVAILAVSANPRLERIVLVDGRRPARPYPEPPSPIHTHTHPSPATAYAPFSPSSLGPSQPNPNPQFSPSFQAPFSPGLNAKAGPARARLAINTNTAYTPGQCSPSGVPVCMSPSQAPAAYPPVQVCPTSPQVHEGGIIGTGLFLMEARKHARLGELIRSGTVVVRGRAFTMGSPGK